MDRVRKVLGCDLPEIVSYTGENIYVAVLDSGIASHPDIKDRVVAFKDFTNTKKQKISKNIFYDDNGHGTHVCGILAGNGKMSNGKYKGIAPECKLICGKVLDKKGGGSLKCLLEGLEWILEIKKYYYVKILNISIEMDTEENLNPNELRLLRKYFELIWKENILIVVAAGNKGPNPMTLSPLGECGSCVCVGCNDGGYVGKNGRSCKEYSGRGPGKEVSAIGIVNPLKKPDIVAPGTDIISCNNKYNVSAYIAKSGTSMSAPIVSGACALCLQKYPEITNIELRRMIINTAKDLGESWSVQGAGMIQIKELMLPKNWYKY